MNGFFHCFCDLNAISTCNAAEYTVTIYCIYICSYLSMQSGFYSLDQSEELPPVTYGPKVDLAMKHISKLEKKFRQLSSTVADLQQSIDRLERQYPVIVIQALPSQPTGPLGSHTASASSLSSFVTAPSRSNSARSEISNDYVLINGSSQMGSSAMAMYTAVTNYNLRLLSQPPIPAQPFRSVSQPGNRHASGNWSLQGIPARESQDQREDSVGCSQVVCLSIPYYIAIDSQHPGKMW